MLIKRLFFILILFLSLSLSWSANATIKVTSPLYMPRAGEIYSNFNLGYFEDDSNLYRGFDNGNNKSKKPYLGGKLKTYGQIGIFDALSINYGFDFDFARKVYGINSSSRLTGHYIGGRFRFLNDKKYKADLILNIGEQYDYLLLEEIDRSFSEVVLKYGMGFDFYNFVTSVKGRYINAQKYAGNLMADSGFNLTFSLENEFIFNKKITSGLDFYYALNDDQKPCDSYNVFGFNLDLNYALKSNKYIGFYYGMESKRILTESENNNHDMFKILSYNSGIRYIFRF